MHILTARARKHSYKLFLSMRIIYSLVTGFYYLAIRLAATWNPKASKWVEGRKNWRRRMSASFSGEDKVIWIHCASLGEFEQGRPVIDWIRQNRPTDKILLTFFSPSGYEKRKDYPAADVVLYLPADRPKNARDMLDLVPVRMALFIKYEFWYYYLDELRKRNISTFLISGYFRRSQLFFKWYGGWYRKMLRVYTQIFVQDHSSLDLLHSIGIKGAMVAGDTRFDRVMQIAGNIKKVPLLEKFRSRGDIVVGGSTWEEDEQALRELYVQSGSSLQLIIAPHEPTIRNIERLREMFPDHLLFSQLDQGAIEKVRVIIVDTIGHLSALYHYGTIAMIGGGFGKGIHNVLEATAAGLPVFFGPNYKRFHEARELVRLGCAFPVTDPRIAGEEILALLADRNELDRKSAKASRFTAEKTGATDRIVNEIFQK